MKNRHLVTALLVAPVLALLTWYGVGFFGETVERPAPAAEGQSYPLVERPGCRYAGGQCRLENQEFKLAVTVSEQGIVTIGSAQPLDSLLVGLRSLGQSAPIAAKPADENRQVWMFALSSLPASSDALRLVAMASGSAYFGEASLVFLENTGES